MWISKDIFNEVINNMPVIPPEAGGIIGGKEGKVILWEYDAGHKESGCMYRPDVDRLNSLIASWCEKDYEFMGIAHVHFGGSRSLSEGDKTYIRKIMEAMPSYIEKLYFPLVVQPEKEMFVFLATRNGNEVIIKQDEITIG